MQIGEPLYTACMTRRIPLPPEIYALVEQTPATVLLEGGKQNDSETKEKPWTQLFTAPLRVCVAYSPAEIPPLFAEIENAVAAGHCAAGFFSYECVSCFEPKAGTRVPNGKGNRWPGLGSTSEATLSIMPRESLKAASRRSSSDSAASCRMRNRQTSPGDRRGVRAQRGRIRRAHRTNSRVDSRRRRLSAELYRADEV